MRDVPWKNIIDLLMFWGYVALALGIFKLLGSYKMKALLWLIFIYPFYMVRLAYLEYKTRNLEQKSRVGLYKQNPFMEGSVGIGYKDGKLYDWLQKRYVRN